MSLEAAPGFRYSMEAMATGEENFKGSWSLQLLPRLALLQEAHPGCPCQAQLPPLQDSAEFSTLAPGPDICVPLTQVPCAWPPTGWSSAPLCAVDLQVLTITLGLWQWFGAHYSPHF